MNLKSHLVLKFSTEIILLYCFNLELQRCCRKWSTFGCRLFHGWVNYPSSRRVRTVILRFTVFDFDRGVKYLQKYRSSLPEVFCKRGVLENLAKFTGKHLCQSPFFNKVAGLCNFIKKETLSQLFSYEFCEIFQKTFFLEQLRWLLVKIVREKMVVVALS